MGKKKANIPVFDSSMFPSGDVVRIDTLALTTKGWSAEYVEHNGKERLGFFVKSGEDLEFFESGDFVFEDVVWKSNHGRTRVEQEKWLKYTGDKGRVMLGQYGIDEYKHYSERR